MDILLTRITLKEDGNYSNRISSFTPQEKKNLYQWYKGLTGEEKKIIDDGYSDNSSKMKPGRVLKAVKPDDERDPMYGIDDENDKAVNYFVDFILIPSIRVANDNPRTSEKLHELFKKVASGSSASAGVSGGVSRGVSGGPVVSYQQLQEYSDAEVGLVGYPDDDTVINNFCIIVEGLMEDFIDETNETGPQMCQNILSLLLACGARALQLIGLIKNNDRIIFNDADNEGKFWIIYEKFLSTFNRLISSAIGAPILFLIIVLVLYQFYYGKIIIDAILFVLNLLILKITGQDVVSLIIEIKEKFWLSLTDFFTNILKETLESWAIHQGKVILGEIIGQKVKGAIGEAVPQIVDQVTNVIADNAAAQTGQIVGAITDSAAVQTGQIVGAITETAAVHSSELVQSTTILARQMLNANGRQLLTFLTPIAAIPVANRLEGMLMGIGAASVSMDELAEKVREADAVLDDILRKSQFTLYEAITAGRDLTPTQIEHIVEMTVDRLKTQDPNLIRATIEGVQQLLTTTTARALMAAPAIQDLLHVGPRRLMNRGGRRTRKNRKARKARKSGKSRKSRKSRRNKYKK